MAKKKQMPTEQQIKERKWCWTGHTLCNPQVATERHALDWNLQGTGKRDSKENGEKNKRRGTAEGWRKAKALALDRTKWKDFKALCSTQKEQKEWMMKPHKKFKCTVKYRLTEYFFLVTAKPKYINHTVSSQPVNLLQYITHIKHKNCLTWIPCASI